MTSRERIEAALGHRSPDRTPVFEYVLLGPLADRLLGRPYAGDPAHWPAVVAELGWGPAVRRNADDRVALAVLLGHDMLYVTPVPPPPGTNGAAAAPAAPGGPAGDPVEAMRRRNEVAALGGPVAAEPLLIYELTREAMACRGVDLPVLAPAYGHGVWTDVELMQTMVLAPEVAHRHFELATARAVGLIERYHQLGVHQVGIGGDFAGNRPIISPAAYRRFIVPEVARLSSRLHELGMYAVNASDGDLWPVIDDFLVGCGVDGYLEIDKNAGMDLGRLKRRFGDRVTFYGNLDCGAELSYSSPQAVRRQTLDCLEAGMGRGGHILCASNAITASVPLDNYLAVVNAYRDCFGLPRFRL
jgi:hypothetical protein